MKNLHFIIALLLLLQLSNSNQLSAQTSNAFNLEEAVDYALDHSNSLKNARLDVLVAESQVKETMAQGLPQVNGSAGYTNNIVIQKALLPASFITGDPNSEGSVALEFGVAHQGNFAISLQQLIFDGKYFLGLKAAKEFVALSEKQTKLTEVEIVENVSKAYLNVLVTEERVKMLEVTLSRLDTLLYESKELYTNGFIEKNDLDRTRVAYNNTKTEVQKVKQLLNLSKEVLKFQMGMEMQEELLLKQTIKDFEIDADKVLSQEGDYTNRPEYEVLDQATKLGLLNVKQYKVGYYPSIYGSATYGQNAGGNELQAFDRWWGFANIGISINVPIFDGFYKAAKIQQAELEVQKSKNQMADLKRSVELEKRQAAISLKSNIETLAAEKRNMELAADVYRIAKIKYDEGVGSLLEVTTANGDYDQAETNYYVALYEALVAKINYEKAIGQLLSE